MLFPEHLVVVRGGGDLATGVVLRLHRAGFPVVVLELARPLAIRRAVAVAAAVIESRVTIEDLEVERVDSPAAAMAPAARGAIPVLVSQTVPTFSTTPSVIVDARMAKRNIDTAIDQAPLVIALGPGFTAGVDSDAVVETMRGHHLGRVIWAGNATADTGVPGSIGGKSVERVVHSPATGVVSWNAAIGDITTAGTALGNVDGATVAAPIDGVVRGLIADGSPVTMGLKIADVDPRADPTACFEVSDKGLAVGAGVVEAVLTWLNGRSR